MASATSSPCFRIVYSCHNRKCNGPCPASQARPRWGANVVRNTTANFGQIVSCKTSRSAFSSRLAPTRREAYGRRRTFSASRSRRKLLRLVLSRRHFLPPSCSRLFQNLDHSEGGTSDQDQQKHQQNVGLLTGFRWIEPGGCWQFLLKNCRKTSHLLDVSGRCRKGHWCPREDSRRAPKQLISHVDWQQEIADTIISTNTSLGTDGTPDKLAVMPSCQALLADSNVISYKFACQRRASP